MSDTTSATTYSIKSNLHKLIVEKQNKLALNPFDDKRVYVNPIQSLKAIVLVYIVEVNWLVL